MTTRIDRVVLTVTANGVDCSDYVARLRLRFGYDLRVSEAEVDLYDLPAGIDYWDTLVVSCGLTGTGTAGNVERFSGYITDVNYDIWPTTIRLEGRGPLILADRLRVPEDEEAENIASPLPLPDYEAPGIDMSLNPDTDEEWSDADMVAWALNKAGLGGRIAQIGGTGKTLGTNAIEQFTWRRGQSALEFIEELDGVCLGHRTFEGLGGLIYRLVTSPRVPFVDSRIDVTEGSHPLESAKLNRGIKGARNRVVVKGFDDGAGPVLFQASCEHPAPPPGIQVETEYVSSPLIEYELIEDGPGLSCQEVAAWKLDEVRHAWIEAVVPTWQDDAFQVGGTAYLNAPHLGSVNQSLWIKHIEIEVGEDGFTQTLTLRGAVADALRIAPVPGAFALPSALVVNP